MSFFAIASENCKRKLDSVRAFIRFSMKMASHVTSALLSITLNDRCTTAARAEWNMMILLILRSFGAEKMTQASITVEIMRRFCSFRVSERLKGQSEIQCANVLAMQTTLAAKGVFTSVFRLKSISLGLFEACPGRSCRYDRAKYAFPWIFWIYWRISATFSSNRFSFFTFEYLKLFRRFSLRSS